MTRITSEQAVPKDRTRLGQWAPETAAQKAERAKYCSIGGKLFTVAEIVATSERVETLEQFADALGVTPRHCSAQLSKLRAKGVWVKLFRCGPPEGRRSKGYGEFQPVCDQARKLAHDWLHVSEHLSDRAHHDNMVYMLALRVSIYLAKVFGGVPNNAFQQTLKTHGMRAANYVSWVEALRDSDPAFDSHIEMLGQQLIDMHTKRRPAARATGLVVSGQ